MSRAAFNQVIERAPHDEVFQARLQGDPVRALAVYELTTDEFLHLRTVAAGADPSAFDQQDSHRPAGAASR